MAGTPDYWLSRTTTDATHPQSIMDAIAEAFGTTRRHRADHGILWRAEPDLDTGRRALLIKSNTPPHHKDYETKGVHGFLAKLTPGARLNYRIHLSACAVHRDPDTQKPIERSLPPSDAKSRWVEHTAPKAGLTPDPNPEHTTTTRLTPPGRPKYITNVPAWFPVDQVDGTATITDPDALAKAIINGIGRNKLFGRGLLTVQLIPDT